jgi:hypothetical protein
MYKLAEPALGNTVGLLCDVEEGYGIPETVNEGLLDVPTRLNVVGTVKPITMKNIPNIAKTDVNIYFILFTSYVKKEEY